MAALAIGVGVVSASPSVGAQTPGDGGRNDDVNDPPAGQPDEFSHGASLAAFLVGADDDSAHSSGAVPTCVVPGHPDRPAHYSWWSVQTGDGTYTVGMNCSFEEPIEFVLGTPDGQDWGENLWTRPGVTGADEDLSAIIAEAFASLRPEAAGIQTDPGDNGPGMVGIRTYFWVDDGVYAPDSTTVEDGILSVEVSITPTDDRRVVWDTGEDVFECTEGTTERQESCSAIYDRSSAGQPDVRDGDPAYLVTATYAYEGAYQVFIGELLIDSGTLGQIERTSEAFLPVEEAQAINTDD